MLETLLRWFYIGPLQMCLSVSSRTWHGPRFYFDDRHQQGSKWKTKVKNVEVNPAWWIKICSCCTLLDERKIYSKTTWTTTWPLTPDFHILKCVHAPCHEYLPPVHFPPVLMWSNSLVLLCLVNCLHGTLPLRRWRQHGVPDGLDVPWALKKW